MGAGGEVEEVPGMDQDAGVEQRQGPILFAAETGDGEHLAPPALGGEDVPRGVRRADGAERSAVVLEALVGAALEEVAALEERGRCQLHRLADGEIGGGD